MTKCFNKFKKPCFCPIFGPFSQFLRQKIFFWKIWLSFITSRRFLAPCQNLEQSNDTISRKCPDRWKDGRKDGQTQFHRTLPTTAESSKTPYNLLTFYQVNTRNQCLGFSKQIRGEICLLFSNKKGCIYLRTKLKHDKIFLWLKVHSHPRQLLAT